MPSTPIKSEDTGTHWLSTIRWNGCSEIGYGSLETGIRDMKDGVPVQGSFRLVQHNWHRWEDAHDFIKKALAKGWDYHRIDKVMYFLKGRTK